MSKTIRGCFHVSMDNAESFYDTVRANIEQLQKAEQEVEIQYSTAPIDNLQNPVVYSALIIGRR